MLNYISILFYIDRHVDLNELIRKKKIFEIFSFIWNCLLIWFQKNFQKHKKIQTNWYIEKNVFENAYEKKIFKQK